MEIIAENVLLDGRLALFHTKQKWLAVADLHFGFELSQRAAGRMLPIWGMDDVRTRLRRLVADYKPQRLIILGDIVHDRTAVEPLRLFLISLAQTCEVILIAGNHDRQLHGAIQLRDSFTIGNFEFHHGDCERDASARTQIIGHFHPAAVLRDGAGLRLKFPAFVQRLSCWILPAFSPWAAGTEWTADEQTRVWLCSPKRILRLMPAENAA